MKRHYKSLINVTFLVQFWDLHLVLSFHRSKHAQKHCNNLLKSDNIPTAQFG